MAALQGEKLEIRYIPLNQVVLWDRNPKRHDIGALVDSILRYGYLDPAKFDAALGALVYGNGRAIAVQWIRNDYAREGKLHAPPKGVLCDNEGEWYLPVAFGLDLESRAAAEAFGIAHNNLTMSGGDFTADEMARLWDRDLYIRVLQELAGQDALPPTVDGDDLDALVEYAQNENAPLSLDDDLAANGDAVQQQCPKCGFRF